jgi:hypothetical protein
MDTGLIFHCFLQEKIFFMKKSKSIPDKNYHCKKTSFMGIKSFFTSNIKSSHLLLTK